MEHAFEVTIVERLAVAPDHVELIVKSPELAKSYPGQFCHVLTPGLLRRPLSFSRVDAAHEEVGLLLQVVGPGTRWISERQRGDHLDVMGPLGRGFTPPDASAPWLLVGGGVGIPPLFHALQTWHAVHRGEVTVILGARRREYVLMVPDFKALGVSVWIATDDGSWGEPGNVSPLIGKWLSQHAVGDVMACGPMPMLAAVSAQSQDFKGTVQLALEQRMGCGIGACLACVVPAQPIGPEGPRYRRVCTDGPVFRREELVFSWT